MKKIIKCGVVAAVAVAAGFAAYQSYGSYGVQNNSLLMQNIEALAQGIDADEEISGVSTLKWKNTHSPKEIGITPLGTVIYSDSIFRGECSSKLCNSEKEIEQAEHDGYAANSCHSHGFQVCKVDLTQL